MTPEQILDLITTWGPRAIIAYAVYFAATFVAAAIFFTREMRKMGPDGRRMRAYFDGRR